MKKFRTNKAFSAAVAISACTLAVGVGRLALADFNGGTFGSYGLAGLAGINGNPGIDGPNEQVVATGQVQSFSLQGQNGGDGGSGQPGQNAGDCRQPPLGPFNDSGANGGNGGDAGQGAPGGNGGSLTVYYSDITKLKTLLVNAAPGAGGRSGYPGQGGAPCICSVRDWLVPVQVCHQENSPALATQGPGGPGGKPTSPPAKPTPTPAPTSTPTPQPSSTTVCQTVQEQFQCLDGNYGQNGQIFQDGATGAVGNVTLIHSLTPLSPTNPQANVTIGNFPTQLTLTTDNWSSSTGATQLFEAGSVINDTYTYWVGRVTVPVTLVWNASLAQSQANGQSIGLALDPSGQISANLTSSNIWAELNTTYASNGAATVSVEQAVLAGQTTELTGVMTGAGQNIVLTLTDPANISDVVNTQISATIVSEGIFGHTRFNGVVPANLITTTDAKITLAIGQIPGLPSGDIAVGKKLKVTLQITRSLGGQSATQQIVIEQKLSS